MLLAAMTGDSTLFIDHEPSGKPFISPASCLSISISHTRGYAAILLSDSTETCGGVDIEYRSDRVQRIARRFIHDEEHAETTDDMLVLWSAKEAVYKCYSEDNLMFFDMRMRQKDDKTLLIENMKRGIHAKVYYEITNDYVLTYTIQGL